MPYPLPKRIFDIIAGSIAFICTLPFYPFIALAIVLESGFPVFVTLERVSEGKRTGVYKFRTMIRHADEMKNTLMASNERNDGPLFKIKNDPRVTKVGKVLRKFRIDEFPQVVNVLQGRLALVGPRPHEPEEVKQYPAQFKKITLARGGLTGLSQVSGASALPFEKELALDSLYLSRQSVWGDLLILAKTFWIFFTDPTGV